MTEEYKKEMWLQMTKVAYYMAEQRGEHEMKYRYVDEIARSLLSNLPNSAHLYVLERLHTIGEHHDLWRQVLVELDKLQGEKHEQEKRLDE